MQEEVWLRYIQFIQTFIIVFLEVLLHYINLPTYFASMAPSAVWLLTLHLMFCYFLFAEIVRAMTHVINQGMSMYWGTSRWSAMEIMVSKYSCVLKGWDKDHVYCMTGLYDVCVGFNNMQTYCLHLQLHCGKVLVPQNSRNIKCSWEQDNMARSQLHQKLFFWPEFFLKVKMQQ